MTAPPFVGLTGGIGAGKSEALAALGRLGAATISADKVVHDLYEDPEVRAAVVERWGAEVAPEGRVDRSRVARSAFATDADRHWLESLIWPRVAQRIGEWRAAESAREPAPPALVVETPLLFEAGLQDNYDATIAIVADEAVRAERAGRAATRRSTSAPPASSHRPKRPNERPTLLRTPAVCANLSRSCRGFLRSSSLSHGHP